MNIRDLIAEAVRALETNKVRNLFTILGIVIGIAAVIAMTSLIGGVRNTMVGSLGLNAARVIHLDVLMTQSDVDKLAKAMPEYEFIGGEFYTGVSSKIGKDTYQVGVQGANSDYLNATGQLKLGSGRVFTPGEEASGARVVIIDRGAVKILFGDTDSDAIGKSITIVNEKYTVVGISDVVSAQSYDSKRFQVCFPLKTAQQDFGSGYKDLMQIMALAHEGQDIDSLIEPTKAQIIKIANRPNSDKDKLNVTSNKGAIQQMNKYMMAFQLIIGSIAGISLLVGGIGIMNMMLANVNERIREIGLRRALGATRHNITTQFLFESSVLCVAGGIIGTIVGYLIAWALSLTISSLGIASHLGGGAASTKIEAVISPETILLAVGVSVAIGIIFGYYPARKAAKLNPVESLRYQ